MTEGNSKKEDYLSVHLIIMQKQLCLNIQELNVFMFKVIPQYCIAHPYCA